MCSSDAARQGNIICAYNCGLITDVVQKQASPYDYARSRSRLCVTIMIAGKLSENLCGSR
jgi:hypothetical protein